MELSEWVCQLTLSSNSLIPVQNIFNKLYYLQIRFLYINL